VGADLDSYRIFEKPEKYFSLRKQLVLDEQSPIFAENYNFCHSKSN
jgi:hypothetical protein